MLEAAGALEAEVGLDEGEGMAEGVDEEAMAMGTDEAEGEEDGEAGAGVELGSLEGDAGEGDGTTVTVEV